MGKISNYDIKRDPETRLLKKKIELFFFYKPKNLDWCAIKGRLEISVETKKYSQKMSPCFLLLSKGFTHYMKNHQLIWWLFYYATIQFLHFST